MVKLVHSFAFLAAAAQFVNGLTLTADAITLYVLIHYVRYVRGRS